MKQKISRALSCTAIILTLIPVLMIANILPPIDLSVFADQNVSETDTVSPTEITLPYVNRINVFENPLEPTASGMLSHSTSYGSSITVAQLFSDLGLTEDPDDVTGIDCNTRFFDTTQGTGGSRIITTKRDFDTLETLTFQFEDGTTLPVIFKDSLYVTNIAPLCTDVSILINGKNYSSSSTETYDEKVPVSGRKPYDPRIHGLCLSHGQSERRPVHEPYHRHYRPGHRQEGDLQRRRHGRGNRIRRALYLQEHE